MDDVVAAPRRSKAAWKCAWSRSWPPVPDASPPVFLATAHRSGHPRRRSADGAVRPRHADREEGRDRSRHRDRSPDRARVPRDDRRPLSRPRRARRGVRGAGAARTTCRSSAGCSIPIDGTTNFAHGLPIFCSSLALEIDGDGGGRRRLRSQPAGAVHGRAGRGAWLNGAPLRVSSAASLIDALLCTGFPYNVQNDEPDEDWSGCSRQFLGISRAVRRLGSAAIDLCYVAAGRFDGFWEMKLGPWDIVRRSADRRRRRAGG